MKLHTKVNKIESEALIVCIKDTSEIITTFNWKDTIAAALGKSRIMVALVTSSSGLSPLISVTVLMYC